MSARFLQPNSIIWWASPNAYQKVIQYVEQLVGSSITALIFDDRSEGSTSDHARMLQRCLDEATFVTFIEAQLIAPQRYTAAYPWHWSGILWNSFKGTLLSESPYNEDLASFSEASLAGMVITASAAVLERSMTAQVALQELTTGIRQILSTWYTNETERDKKEIQLWSQLIHAFSNLFIDSADSEVSQTQIAGFCQHLFGRAREASSPCSCHVLENTLAQNAPTPSLETATLTNPPISNEVQMAQELYASYLKLVGFSPRSTNFVMEVELYSKTQSNSSVAPTDMLRLLDGLTAALDSRANQSQEVRRPKCQSWCILSPLHCIIDSDGNSVLDSPPQLTTGKFVDIDFPSQSMALQPQNLDRSHIELRNSKPDLFNIYEQDCDHKKKSMDLYDVVPQAKTILPPLQTIACPMTGPQPAVVKSANQSSSGTTVPVPGTQIRPLLAPLNDPRLRATASPPPTNHDSHNPHIQSQQNRVLNDISIITPRRLAPLQPQGSSRKLQDAVSPRQSTLDVPATPARLAPIDGSSQRPVLNAATRARSTVKPAIAKQQDEPQSVADVAPTPLPSIPGHLHMKSSLESQDQAQAQPLNLGDLLRQLPDDSRPRRGSSSDTHVVSLGHSDHLEVDADADAFLQEEKLRVAENLPPSPVLGGRIVDRRGSITNGPELIDSRPLDIAVLSSVPVAPELLWKRRAEARTGSGSGSIAFGGSEVQHEETEQELRERMQIARAIAAKVGLRKEESLRVLQGPPVNDEADRDIDPEAFVAAEKECNEEPLEQTLGDDWNLPPPEVQETPSRIPDGIPYASANEPATSQLRLQKPEDGRLQAELEMLGLDQMEMDDDIPDADAESLGSSFDEPDAPSSMMLSDSEDDESVLDETSQGSRSDCDDDAESRATQPINSLSPDAAKRTVGDKSASQTPKSARATLDSAASGARGAGHNILDPQDRVEQRTIMRMRRNSQTGMINGVMLGADMVIVASDRDQSAGCIPSSSPGGLQPTSDTPSQPTYIATGSQPQMESLRIQVDSSPVQITPRERPWPETSVIGLKEPPKSVRTTGSSGRSPSGPQSATHSFMTDSERPTPGNASATTPSPLPGFTIGTAPFTYSGDGLGEDESHTQHSFSWDPTRRLEWEEEDEENSRPQSDDDFDGTDQYGGLPGEVPVSSRRKPTRTRNQTKEKDNHEFVDENALLNSQAARRALSQHRRSIVEQRLGLPQQEHVDDSNPESARSNDVVKAALELAASGKFVPQGQKPKASAASKYRQLVKGDVTELTAEHRADIHTGLPGGSDHQLPGRSGTYTTRGGHDDDDDDDSGPRIEEVSGGPRRSVVRAGEGHPESPMTRARNMASRFEADGSDFDISDCAGNGRGDSSVAVGSITARGSSSGEEGVWAEPTSKRGKDDDKDPGNGCGCKASCTIA